MKMLNKQCRAAGGQDEYMRQKIEGWRKGGRIPDRATNTEERTRDEVREDTRKTGGKEETEYSDVQSNSMEVKAIIEGIEGDLSLDEAEASIQKIMDENAQGGGEGKEQEIESKRTEQIRQDQTKERGDKETKGAILHGRTRKKRPIRITKN